MPAKSPLGEHHSAPTVCTSLLHGGLAFRRARVGRSTRRWFTRARLDLYASHASAGGADRPGRGFHATAGLDSVVALEVSRDNGTSDAETRATFGAGYGVRQGTNAARRGGAGWSAGRPAASDRRARAPAAPGVP